MRITLSHQANAYGFTLVVCCFFVATLAAGLASRLLLAVEVAVALALTRRTRR
jgi:hypothetical protein